MIFSTPFFLMMFLLGLFSQTALAAETTHVVVRGDTIFSLSRLHGISQEELMRRNGMANPSQLQIGMRLSIPSRPSPSTQAHSEHIVARGETLFSIARSRGVTLQALREANGFSQDHVLRAGERIRIPAAAPNIAGQTNISLAPTHITTGRRADPSLRWPIQATEVTYMSGNSGGVLILGRQSEPVRSISRGTVVHAGPWRGYGNVVIVESTGGFRFLYGANESLSVRIGDVVEPGTEVGKLGIHLASGRPELVFIVLRNGVPVDPATAPRS